MPQTFNNNWSGVGSSFSIDQLGANGGLLSQYDLEPYEERRIRQTYGMYDGFSDILKLYGMTQAVSSPIMAHAEAQRPRFAFQFDQIVTPAGGANLPMTLRIAAPYMASPVNTTVGGVAAKGSILRENDVILLPTRKSARVKTKITTGNQHTFVIEPMELGVNLDTEITSGSLATAKFVIVSNAYRDGDGTGQGSTRDIRKYQAKLQIIKDKQIVTGGALTIDLYHEDETGRRGNVYMVHLAKSMMERYDSARNGALLQGSEATNTSMVTFNPILGHDTQVTGTLGFIPWVEKQGNETIVNYGLYTLDDFRATSLSAKQQRLGVREFMYLHSHQAKSGIDRAILDKFNVTSDRYLEKIYSNLSGKSDANNFTSASDMALKIGYQVVNVDGMTFTFKSLHELDDSEHIGSQVYYQKYSIIAPLGFTTDVENQAKLPMMGYGYRVGKHEKALNRESVVSDFGGFMAHPTPVNNNDIREINIGCDIGFHGYCGNFFFYEHEA